MRKAVALLFATLTALIALAGPASAAKPTLPSCEDQKSGKATLNCDY